MNVTIPESPDPDYERFAKLASPSPLDWLDGLDLHGGRVLHAGCGSGATTIGLTKWFDEIVATDYTEALIAKARSAHPHSKIEYLNVSFVNYSDSTSFDLIFIYMTLHDLVGDEFGKALNNVKKLVRPGGTIVIVDRIVDRPWLSYLQCFADAITNLPGDVARLGAKDALWLLRYRVRPSRMAHQACDVHLTGDEFLRCYRSAFPGSVFRSKAHDRAVIWRKPVQGGDEKVAR